MSWKVMRDIGAASHVGAGALRSDPEGTGSQCAGLGLCLHPLLCFSFGADKVTWATVHTAQDRDHQVIPHGPPDST